MQQAFVFTMDALFALSAIVLLSTSYVVLNSLFLESQKFSSLDQEGRDYLYLAYVRGYSLSNEGFRNLTGHTLYGGLGEKYWPFDTAAEVGEWTQNGTGWHWNSSLGGTYKHNISIVDELAYVGDVKWKNYEVSAYVVLLSATANEPAAGVSARINATGGRYACVLFGNSKLTLLKLSSWLEPLPRWTATLGLNGSKTVTTEGDPGLIGKWHYLSLNVTGNFVNCSAIGYGATLQSIVYTDPTPLRRGSAGLEGTQYTDAFFNNVSIKYVKTLPPLNPDFMVRANLHAYPEVCQCDFVESMNCTVKKEEACLRAQEQLLAANYTNEVWVG